MEKELDLYFDGVLKTCYKKEDRNGEYLYEAEDGSFVKFPSSYAEGDSFEAAVERYNRANGSIPEIIPDVTYGQVTVFDKEGNEIK